ncbi:MAG: O-antigen ligase family protein, partial [Methylocystaceae bacterium]
TFKVLFNNYKIRRSYINISLLILTLLVVLSTSFADYKTISLFGTYDRYEGSLSMLCYLILFFTAANTNINNKHVKFINYALSIVIGINVVIGVLKFWGFDLIGTDFMRVLLLPESMRNASLLGSIGSTLENPNYLSGLFGALMAYFALMTLATYEKTGLKVIYLILCISSFILVLSSRSASGFIGLLAVLVIFIPIIFIMTSNRIAVLRTLAISFVFLSVVFITMYYRLPTIYNDFLGTVGNIVSFVIPSNASAQKTIDSNLPEVSKPGASDISSGRFFIWSRTIDLIYDKPFLGYGAGTLAYYFPQNDPDKIIYLKSWNSFVSKSHNQYIETAFSFGVPALLILVILFVSHLYRSFIDIYRQRMQFGPVRLALLGFFCVYLIQWVFNDTTIGGSVVFWILFGVAVSLNYSKETARD